eukprot:Skav200261  [mRNA]  locus=scaffold128:513123:516573:+ [translate_table: standard]
MKGIAACRAPLLCLCFLLGVPVFCLDNGLGRTPAMGYNTWNDFECEGVSAANITKVADKMVELGFLALGYEYLVIDDCWASARGEDGVLIPDPAAFPDGMKPFRDALNASGRPVYLALSGWHNWYSAYGAGLANSWRVGYDVRNWQRLGGASGPGGGGSIDPGDAKC